MAAPQPPANPPHGGADVGGVVLAVGMDRVWDVVIDEAGMDVLGDPPDAGPDVDRFPVDPDWPLQDALWEAEFAGKPVDPIRAGLDRLTGLQQRMSSLQAAQARELAGLAELTRAAVQAETPEGTPGWARSVEIAQRSLVAEIALATRVSARTVENRLGEAELLVGGFPLAFAALTAGRIGLGHARVILDHGSALTDPAVRAEFERIVVERAVTVTPGRLARTAELTATRLSGQPFEQRHEQAAAARTLSVHPSKDGMAQVMFYLPALLAAGIWDRLTRQAKAIRTTGRERSLDQIRTDLAAELLLAGQPGTGPDAPHGAGYGITAEVCILIPALTLLGQGQEPATLAGRGPIGMAEATALAAAAPSLLRILTDPVTEQVLAVDSYRPSEKLRRFLRLRDGRCKFPICNALALRSDIDHTIPAADGGPTEAGNLECLCRGDHILKHHGGWTVRQISPGVLEWTSPHGLTATDQPEAPSGHTSTTRP